MPKSKLTKTKIKTKMKPRSKAKAKASVAIEVSAVTEPQSGFAEPIESEKLTVETPERPGPDITGQPVHEYGEPFETDLALKPPSHRYLMWGIVLVVLMLAASYFLIMY